MSQPYSRLRLFRRMVIVTFILLVIQYVLGMISNLYVSFPNALSGGDAWAWTFMHSPLIVLHIVNGTLLLAFSLILIGLSMTLPDSASKVTAILGFVMILFAWLSGFLFVANGQANTTSFLMSLGFIGAFMTYAIGYYAQRSAQTATLPKTLNTFSRQK